MAQPVLCKNGASRRAAVRAVLVAVAAVYGLAPAFLPGTAPLRHSGQIGNAQELVRSSRMSLLQSGPISSRLSLAAEYGSMKVADLKTLCKEKGLTMTGKKADLVARLEEADGASEEAADDEEEEEKEEEEEEEEEKEEEEEEDEKPSSASSADGFKKGQLALAKFQDDGRYYSVIIKKDNGDDTFDINWVQDDAEDTANLEDLRIQDKKFKKGDLVVAKCAGDGKRYTAHFVKGDGKGRTTVAWIEDGSEEEVLLDDVFKNKKKFKVGQAVEGKFPEDGEWYGAKVTKDKGKGKFEVEWDEDGDGPMEMLIDDIRIPRVDIDSFEVGQKLQGTVLRIAPFGAFVDVGAWTDGLVHVSKMAEGRVEDPSEYVAEDDEVTVWVTNVDTEQRRLGLTLVESKVGGGGGRRAPKDITVAMEDIEVGNKYEGTVESVREFGAFVDIGSERAGLVHISRMAEGFVENPEDYAKVGDKVSVWVTSVGDGKLGLSMVEESARPRDSLPMT